MTKEEGVARTPLQGPFEQERVEAYIVIDGIREGR